MDPGGEVTQEVLTSLESAGCCRSQNWASGIAAWQTKGAFELQHSVLTCNADNITESGMALYPGYVLGTIFCSSQRTSR